jgi:nicotinate-nucleotide adenylyltransferase
MDQYPGETRRVAFFGGTFDPPHLGHLGVARAARAALGLDTVFFAPVGTQPLRPQGAVANFEDRLAMTRLAIAAEPGFALSFADAPKSSGAPNYTLETLLALRAQLPPSSALFCLMGADSFAAFRRWHRAAEIPFVASLIVASRPSESLWSLDNLDSALPEGLTFEPAPITDDLAVKILGKGRGEGVAACGNTSPASHEVLGHNFTACGKMQRVEHEASGHDFSRAVSATKKVSGFSPCGQLSDIPSPSDATIALCRYILRNPAGQQAPFYLLPGLHIDISASVIRDHIRNQAQPPATLQEPAPTLLPAMVLEYIRAHNLYR